MTLLKRWCETDMDFKFLFFNASEFSINNIHVLDNFGGHDFDILMGNNYAPLLKKNTNKLAILFGLVIEQRMK
jgi:hypothetical protein